MLVLPIIMMCFAGISWQGNQIPLESMWGLLQLRINQAILLEYKHAQFAYEAGRCW
jgi:hypothetical protein